MTPDKILIINCPRWHRISLIRGRCDLQKFAGSPYYFQCAECEHCLNEPGTIDAHMKWVRARSYPRKTVSAITPEPNPVISFIEVMKEWIAAGLPIEEHQKQREKLACCYSCSSKIKCPYCGCVKKVKAKLGTIQDCPKKSPRNYWRECVNQSVSVIIPAHDEPYLERTIKNLQNNAYGPLEIIPIIDKDNWGMRKAINQGASKSTGKYLFIIDAHCSMSEGWDTMLKWACGAKDLVHCPIDSMLEDGTIKRRSGTFVYMDPLTLDSRWKGNRKVKKTVEYDETMTGCGWMIQKDFFIKSGGSDETLGGIGGCGSEWSLKIHGNGGRIKIRTDVACGHIYATNKSFFHGHNTPPIKWDLLKKKYGMFLPLVKWSVKCAE